jgi:hypothetical protein
MKPANENGKNKEKFQTQMRKNYERTKEFFACIANIKE